jgi:hypothetical protein
MRLWSTKCQASGLRFVQVINAGAVQTHSVCLCLPFILLHVVCIHIFRDILIRLGPVWYITITPPRFVKVVTLSPFKFFSTDVRCVWGMMLFLIIFLCFEIIINLFHFNFFFFFSIFTMQIRMK